MKTQAEVEAFAEAEVDAAIAKSQQEEQFSVSVSEKEALIDVLGYLERKSSKSTYWLERMAPLMGLIGRLKGAKQ